MPHLMKIRPVAVELFHADGMTNMTKLIVAFRNFANAPHYRSADTHTHTHAHARTHAHTHKTRSFQNSTFFPRNYLAFEFVLLYGCLQERGRRIE